MRERIYQLLKEEGRALSYRQLAQELFKASRISFSLSRRILEPILRNDPAFADEGRGRWRLAECRLEDTPLTLLEFAAVDLETTGGRPPLHKITEIAVISFQRRGEVESFQTLVNPERYIPWSVVRLTGITDAMVADKPAARDVLPEVLRRLEGAVFLGHCAHFDLRFINHYAQEALGRSVESPMLCTHRLARRLFPGLKSYSLDALARHFGVNVKGRHRALGDARATGEIFLRLLGMLDSLGFESLGEVLDFQRAPRGRARSILSSLRSEKSALSQSPSRPRSIGRSL